MPLLYVSSLVLILLAASASVWVIRQSYVFTIDGLRTDNKDLRDRLFQSKGLPPTGVNVTEQYQEKQAEKKVATETAKKNGKPPAGPLERRVALWTAKDRADRERGIDLTSNKTH